SLDLVCPVSSSLVCQRPVAGSAADAGAERARIARYANRNLRMGCFQWNGLVDDGPDAGPCRRLACCNGRSPRETVQPRSTGAVQRGSGLSGSALSGPAVGLGTCSTSPTSTVPTRSSVQIESCQARYCSGPQ